MSQVVAKVAQTGEAQVALMSMGSVAVDGVQITQAPLTPVLTVLKTQAVVLAVTMVMQVRLRRMVDQVLLLSDTRVRNKNGAFCRAR
jgi:hypothetical protein